MPSMFRISPYGRCAFTGTLSFVSGAPGAELTEDQVIAHVRTRIAGYKRPQRVHFAAALPRNASMKVRKDQLRDRLAGQPAGEGSRRA
jgi:acyl-coenzyme A synthetase/AMP-(fatty) acid ligase